MSTKKLSLNENDIAGMDGETFKYLESLSFEQKVNAFINREKAICRDCGAKIEKPFVRCFLCQVKLMNSVKSETATI